MKPLITSLKEFYSGIFELNQSKNFFSIDSIGVRKELFKLNYMSQGQGKFNLNDKAEAFEVLDYLLCCIHTWVQAIRSGAPLPG